MTLDAIALDTRDRLSALFRAAAAHLCDVTYLNMLHATFADPPQRAQSTTCS